MKYKKSIFWEDKENTFKESHKYSSRMEFYKKSHGAYVAAKKNNWLIEMTWLNRKNVYKDPIDIVYRYYFPSNNAVYVGRTIYPSLRDKQHRTKPNDSVYRFSNENNVEIPKMEILEEGLTVTQGAEREVYWEKYYKDKGFLMINKQPCGSLGSMAKGKWSKSKCFEEAKKYKSRSEFQKNSSQAYAVSRKKGWLDDMHWIPQNNTNPKGYWKNKDNFLNEAKKYTSKKELEKNNLAAYLAGLRYNYFNDVTWFTERKCLPFGYWKDKEHTMEEGKKYTSRNEFRKANQSAYWAALKYGYLDNMDWLKENNHMPRGYWKNKDVVIEEGKKYKTRKEFMEGNRGAYEASHRYGFINEMTWLRENTQKPSGYWNKKERVIEESKKYKSRTEFKNGSNGAYNSAKKHKWLDEMTWFAKKVNSTRRKEKPLNADNKFRGKWTKEKCIEEAMKYNSISEFMNNSNSAYQRSIKMGYVKEMHWLKNSRKYPRGYWMVKENVINEAKKYKTKKDFEKGNCSAYQAALKYKFIKEINWNDGD